jgi:adenosine deaminase
MEQKKKSFVDLHNHSTAGGTQRYLNEHGLYIPIKDNYNGIEELNCIWGKCLNDAQNTKEGLTLLLDANFKNCIASNVKVVYPTISYRYISPTSKLFPNDPNAFIDFLKQFQYDGLRIDWILNINRDRYHPRDKEAIDTLLNTKFFKGLDLASTESFEQNKEFKDFYKTANTFDMVTQVHCGEQLGADYVLQCIKDFEPKQIQHGITIVQNPKIMKIARQEGITFNVCPTSNISLGYVKDYKSHPISTMYYNDLSITIGTDDMLFFNSTVPQEYAKLRRCKTLTNTQLEEIRMNSLRVAGCEAQERGINE